LLRISIESILTDDSLFVKAKHVPVGLKTGSGRVWGVMEEESVESRDKEEEE